MATNPPQQTTDPSTSSEASAHQGPSDNAADPPKQRPDSYPMTESPQQCAGRYRPAILGFLLIAAVTLAADLITKALAFKHVAPTPVRLTQENAGDPTVIPFHEPIVLIPRVLSLKLTTNTGAVFGLGKGGQGVFMIVSVLAVGVIGRVFWQSPRQAWGFHLALSLILAGALGNLYDRVCFNAVRDLLWLFPGSGLWPWIFNIADAALMVGVGLMMVVMWRSAPWQPADQTTPD